MTEELQNTAWACAALLYRNTTLFSSISESVLAKINEIRIEGFDISSFAWAFARLRLSDAELLDAISDASLRSISELCPQSLSNLSWADSKLGRADETLLDAISEQAIRQLEHFPAQYLVSMVDLDLPCASVFQDALGALLIEIFGSTLELLDSWPWAGTPPFLQGDPMNSLGAIGTRLMLAKMCVPQATASFCEEARARIADVHALVKEAELDYDRGDLLVEKTWSFAAFDLAIRSDRVLQTLSVPHHRTIQGHIVKDNGFKHAKPSRWLRTVEMKTHEWVDRSQCGEYQLLAEVCDRLAEEGGVDFRSARARTAVSGVVQVFVLSPPCLSCVSVLRQFQQLLPGAALRASLAESPYVLRV